MEVKTFYELIGECTKETMDWSNKAGIGNRVFKFDTEVAGVLLSYTFSNPDIFKIYEANGREGLKSMMMNFIINYIKVKCMTGA